MVNPHQVVLPSSDIATVLWRRDGQLSDFAHINLADFQVELSPIFTLVARSDHI
jgi:hypothetical protein